MDLWQQLVQLTGADKSLGQDECKAVPPAPRSTDANLTASNSRELEALFSKCASVRKQAFQIWFVGLVDDGIVELMLRARPSCVSTVTFRDCVFSSPTCETALRRKTHFFFE